MISKILFTIVVVLIVLLIWRTRQSQTPRYRPDPRVINPPRPSRKGPIRGLAIAAVAILLATSGYLLYEFWRDNNEVIYIRVVDASTGRSEEYRAQRGDIDDREFVTTDGRRIVLAETERLETSTIRQPVALDRN